MKNIIKFSIVSLISLVFFMPKYSYAYWTQKIEYSASNTQVSVTLGEWEYIKEWDPDPEEPYQVGDIVFYNGQYYIRTNHGSSSNKPPDSGHHSWAFWDPIAPITDKPIWVPNPEVPYQEGDIVYYHGKYYLRTNRGGTSNKPPDSGHPSWIEWDPDDEV